MKLYHTFLLGWDLYAAAQERRWGEVARLLAPHIPIPRYTPSIRADMNAIGVDACAAALYLDDMLSAFLACLTKDEQVKGVTSEFSAAVGFARIAIRRFVAENFDQPTIDKSAERVGVVTTLKSRVPADVPAAPLSAEVIERATGSLPRSRA